MSCVSIFRKSGQLWLFWPKFAQNGFLVWTFGKLMLEKESASLRYHACQFSDRTDNFDFFDLNLGKFPNYVRYFGLKIVEGVAESWVETDMSWVEVDGCGWRWMHGLANILAYIFNTNSTPKNKLGFLVKSISNWGYDNFSHRSVRVTTSTT